MKKLMILVLMATGVAAGCSKDEILPFFPDNTSGGSATDGGSSTDSGATDSGATDGGTAVVPETSEEDVIDNTTFARTIAIVFSDTSGATVTGDENGIVTVNGNQVTADNTQFDENVKFTLSGSSSNGFFKTYSNNRQALVLNGVSLTNPNGAAIDNQGKKRYYIVVNGTNTLADGASAAYSTSNDEDQKAVLFSEGQIVFSGSGKLTVNANNAQAKSGIASDDYLYLTETPAITVTAGNKAGHGVRGKDYVRIAGGTLNVTTKAAMKKGIGSDGFVLVEGGNTTINVSGGTAYDSEDQEYKGSAGIKADNYFGMTGGTVTITNSGAGGKGVHAGSYDYDPTTHVVNDSYISGGTLTITTTGSESNDVSSKGIKVGWVTKNGSGERATVTGYGGSLMISGGKVIVKVSKSEGIEAKGNLVISGGETYVYSTGDDAINCQAELDVTGGYVYAFSSANDAMDANHDLKLSGGYVFAVCTKGSPEVALDANTESRYKLYIESGATVVAYGGLESGYSASQSIYSMSCSAGNWNALSNGNTFLAAFKAPSGVSSVAVSAPSLSKGYSGVSVNGENLCNGVWATDGISGGSSVSLNTYSGGGGPGGGGPGGGGFPW